MQPFIQVCHVSPGRVRLRLLSLRRDHPRAVELVASLEGLEGMDKVAVRPYTGSVVCEHDPELLSLERILQAVRAHTGIERVVPPGEPVPQLSTDELRAAIRDGSKVAREASRMFQGLNHDVLRATEGELDLGTLTTLGFLGAGTVEVLLTGKLPLPSWFNLGWWAVRTFISFETRAIDGTRVSHDASERTPEAGAQPPEPA